MTFWNPGYITTISNNPENSGSGDPIHDAFTKVNNNFGNISAQLSGVNQDWLNANVSYNTNLNYAKVSNLFVANATGTTFNFSGNTTSDRLIANTGIYSHGTSVLTGNTTVGNIDVTGLAEFLGPNVKVSTHFTPSANISYDLGSPTQYFRNVYALGTISVNQATLGVSATMLDIPTNPADGDINDVGILTTTRSNGSNNFSYFGYQNSTQNFIYYQTTLNPGIGTGVIGGGVYGNVQFGSQYLSNATAATSTTSGALIVAGGISTQNNIYASGNITTYANVNSVTLYGNLVGTSANVTTITGPSNGTGNVSVYAGNAFVSGNLYSNGYQVITTNTPGITLYTGTSVFSSNVTITSAWNANSPTSGALVLSTGGAGVVGNVWSGQYVTANSGFVGQLRGDQNSIGNISLGGTITLNGVTGQINASSLQATSLGVTNITAIGTLNFSSATITGLAGMTVAGNIVTGNISTSGTVSATSVVAANVSGSIYDNGNRVVSTSSGSGNLTLSGTGINLSATGPGAVTMGNATSIPVVTTDVYGRVTALTSTNISTTLNTAGSSGTGNVNLLTQSLSFASGTGISTSASAQTITITNTGVTGIVGTSNISANASVGVISLSSTDTLDSVVNRGATTSTSVTLSGGATFGGTVIPNANVSVNLGSTSAWWNTIYGTSTHAQYADLAEQYTADSTYKPGTVVVFGGTAEITTTNDFADTRVAGVISTNPAHLMNASSPGLPVALRGRVPCQLIGPVKKGDLLVTAGSNPGYATSVGADKSHGASIFAKALETDSADGYKVIEVVIL